MFLRRFYPTSREGKMKLREKFGKIIRTKYCILHGRRATLNISNFKVVRFVENVAFEENGETQKDNNR